MLIIVLESKNNLAGCFSGCERYRNYSRVPFLTTTELVSWRTSPRRR